MSMKSVPLTGSPPMPTAVGLAEALVGGLEHRFVGERARARDDADAALLEDGARHDADLALVRGQHAGAVRPDQPRLRAVERALDPDHVEHRNALGDGDDQRHLGVDRLEDRIRGEGRRHVDDAGGGAGRVDRLARRCRTPAGRGGSCRPSPASRRRPSACRRRAPAAVWNVPVSPVMPWVMTLVLRSTRMDIYLLSGLAMTAIVSAGCCGVPAR